jgi:hypothetical protein
MLCTPMSPLIMIVNIVLTMCIWLDELIMKKTVVLCLKTCFQHAQFSCEVFKKINLHTIPVITVILGQYLEILTLCSFSYKK